MSIAIAWLQMRGPRARRGTVVLVAWVAFRSAFGFALSNKRASDDRAVQRGIAAGRAWDAAPLVRRSACVPGTCLRTVPCCAVNGTALSRFGTSGHTAVRRGRDERPITRTAGLSAEVPPWCGCSAYVHRLRFP